MMDEFRKAVLRAAAMLLLTTMSVALFQYAAQAAVYRQGSQGETVKQIQTRLKQWGYYSGAADGIYGSATVAAVKKFQQKNGLAADGIAGAKTLAAIGIAQKASSGGSPSRQSDTELLARMISAEGRGESYKGQVAIGAVILNRVRHPSFPDSIQGVIYQPGAFSALSDGQFDKPVADSSRRAATEVMNGADPTYGCIYYYNPAKTSNKFMLSRPVVIVIGAHRFTK